MKILHQEGQQAPLHTLPLEAAFDVVDGGQDGSDHGFYSIHVSGQSLKDTDRRNDDKLFPNIGTVLSILAVVSNKTKT